MSLYRWKALGLASYQSLIAVVWLWQCHLSSQGSRQLCALMAAMQTLLFHYTTKTLLCLHFHLSWKILKPHTLDLWIYVTPYQTLPWKRTERLWFQSNVPAASSCLLFLKMTTTGTALCLHIRLLPYWEVTAKNHFRWFLTLKLGTFWKSLTCLIVRLGFTQL